MGQLIRTVVAANFVASWFGIFIWIAYSFSHGLPVAEECLGVRGEFGIPAWLDCSIVAVILLLVFFLTKKDWRQRLVIGGVGAWSLVWNLRLPAFIGVPPSMLGSAEFTLDRVVGVYVCIAAVLYGVVGPPRRRVKCAIAS